MFHFFELGPRRRVTGGQRFSEISDTSIYPNSGMEIWVMNSIFKIVGLSKSDNGRHCAHHICCGQSLDTGDFVEFVEEYSTSACSVVFNESVFAVKVKKDLYL